MMKKVLGLRFTNMIAALIVLSVSASASFAADQRFIFTTGDIKQDYDVLGIRFNYQDVHSTFVDEPMNDPTQNAMKAIIKIASEGGADGLIGVRIESVISGQKAKVLAYGTAIKLKASTNESMKDTSTKTDSKSKK